MVWRQRCNTHWSNTHSGDTQRLLRLAESCVNTQQLRSEFCLFVVCLFTFFFFLNKSSVAHSKSLKTPNKVMLMLVYHLWSVLSQFRMLICRQTWQAAVETEVQLVDLSFYGVLPACSSGCWRHSRWSGSTIMWRGASRGSAAPKCWRLFTGSTCWSTRRSLSSPVNHCRPGILSALLLRSAFPADPWQEFLTALGGTMTSESAYSVHTFARFIIFRPICDFSCYIFQGRRWEESRRD